MSGQLHALAVFLPRTRRIEGCVDPGVGQDALKREISLVFVGNGTTTPWTSSPSPGPGLRLGARRVTF